MSIKINIHPTHRQHTDGLKAVASEGKTVREALQYFTARYPGMKSVLFNKEGKLLHYIEIYLNKQSAYPGELEKTVKSGDEIQIITFLAGG
jgi:molybdopterin converting factor small subunit